MFFDVFGVLLDGGFVAKKGDCETAYYPALVQQANQDVRLPMVRLLQHRVPQRSLVDVLRMLERVDLSSHQHTVHIQKKVT